MITEVCLATANRKKAEEITAILRLPGSMKTLYLRDYPQIPEIVEDGIDFIENAVKKAETVADYTCIIAIADDSGLQIDALNGFPGIHSSRYLGPDANDMDRCEDILNRLKNIETKKRTARFVCVAALACPGRATITFQGSIEGIIATKPSGDNGFGYDPIFFLPEQGCTMAEIPASEKNRISHRARAFMALREYLLTIAVRK